MPLSYTVVDLETTGVSVKNDSIIEISALRVIDGVETDSFSTLVSCDKPIPKAASRVNGITDEMLKGAPSCHDAIASLIDFVGNDILVGHNANRFDRVFLERDVRRFGDLSLQNDWIDTLAMARRLYPGERASLAVLCEKFGIVNEQAHRALSDCRATSKCYLAMRDDALCGIANDDERRSVITDGAGESSVSSGSQNEKREKGGLALLIVGALFVMAGAAGFREFEMTPTWFITEAICIIGAVALFSKWAKRNRKNKD